MASPAWPIWAPAPNAELRAASAPPAARTPPQPATLASLTGAEATTVTRPMTTAAATTMEVDECSAASVRIALRSAAPIQGNSSGTAKPTPATATATALQAAPSFTFTSAQTTSASIGTSTSVGDATATMPVVSPTAATLPTRPTDVAGHLARDSRSTQGTTPRAIIAPIAVSAASPCAADPATYTIPAMVPATAVTPQPRSKRTVPHTPNKAEPVIATYSAKRPESSRAMRTMAVSAISGCNGSVPPNPAGFQPPAYASSPASPESGNGRLYPTAGRPPAHSDRLARRMNRTAPIPTTNEGRRSSRPIICMEVVSSPGSRRLTWSAICEAVALRAIEPPTW